MRQMSSSGIVLGLVFGLIGFSGCATGNAEDDPGAPAGKITLKPNLKPKPKPAHAAPALPVGANGLQIGGITKIYQANCMNCHGEHGEGGGAGTQTLLTEDLFDEKLDRRFFNSIKNGVPGSDMDKFGASLDDKTIWGLVVHVRELQRDELKKSLPPRKPDAQGIVKTDKLTYKVETVLDEHQGLRTPWAITFIEDGTLLVTNRPGYLSIARGNKVIGKVENTPTTAEVGQGGLMNIITHPNYKQNHWIYLSFADLLPKDPKAAFTKLVRGKITMSGDKATWGSQQTIFEADQSNYMEGVAHFGNKLVFDGKGHIFLCLGERGIGERAQDLKLPNGKIFRLNEDGTVPKDNPFYAQGGNAAKVWSYGHRNPQGMTMDLEGRIWNTEHGPRGGDKLNIVQKGKNYGWPITCYGINYNDQPWSTPWTDQITAEPPVHRWLPSIAPSGLICVSSPKYPAWHGDLLAGGLAGRRIERIKYSEGRMVEDELVLHDIGRVRDIRQGPDGYVYVVLNRPDKVVRLVPQGQ